MLKLAVLVAYRMSLTGWLAAGALLLLGEPVLAAGVVALDALLPGHR
ncbi:MAG: hypothetical protein WD810_06560 [Solirubrobacterales bacterium]